MAGMRGFQQMPGRHCERQGPLPRVAPRRGPFLSMSRRDAALEGQLIFGRQGPTLQAGTRDRSLLNNEIF